MTDPLKQSDPALAIALDRLVPPRLPADFAERVAQAAASRTPLPAQPAPRRSGRGGWTRGRTAIIGIATFGLMSAAAAATGVFGPITRETPVIGKIVASVAPSLIAAPKPKITPRPKPVMAKAAAPVATEPAADPAIALPPSREERARRFMSRMEERAERRRALGLPPGRVDRRKLRRALKQLPPEERVSTVERLRDQRREAKGLPPLDDAARAQRRARLEQRLEKGLEQGLQQRPPQARLDRINARRARRGLAPLGETPPATD